MFEIDDWDDPDFDLADLLNGDCDEDYHDDNDFPPLRPPAPVVNSILTPARTNNIPSANTLISPKIEPFSQSQSKPLPQTHQLSSTPTPTSNNVPPLNSEENCQNNAKQNQDQNQILPPPPPPIVISPAEVDHISIQLEKNQQCACKDCGKLFNSVWYLKQHAVKHSNDRPFKCKFCLKTYKFRSNLYQHKCPERNRQLGGLTTKRLYTRGIAYTEIHPNKSLPMQPNGFHPAPFVQHHQTLFEAISGNPIHTPPTFPMNPILLQNSAEKKFPELPVPEPIPIVEELKKPNNCIREQPLDQAYIDSYITKNKHKLFPCRKCKILFPSREYLSRHMAYHNYMDSYEFECPKCPQRFIYEKQLVNHLNLHSDNSPHKCLQCEAMFRSSMSLRRHRDQCRSCIRYPFGIQPDLLVSQPTPLDQYAFIESDDEDDHHNLRKVAENLNRQKSATDSGLGSDSSTHSLNNSPNRSHNLDDEFDDHHHHVFHPPESTMLHHKTSTESMIPSTSNGGLRQRKTSEDTETDDVDSGFRSRLNSSIPSCSPGSSGNGSEAGTSPSRKFSANGMNHMANDLFIHGYGSMSYNYHNGHGNSKPIHHQQAPTSAMNYGRNFGSTFVTMTSSDDDDLFSLSHTSSFEDSNTMGLVLTRFPVPRMEKIYYGKESLASTFISHESQSSIEITGDENGNFNPYGYDLTPNDLEDVVKMAVQLFLRRFIVVFFDALIQQGLHQQTTNHKAGLRETISQLDVNNESNTTSHVNINLAKQPSLPTKSDEDGPNQDS